MRLAKRSGRGPGRYSDPRETAPGRAIFVACEEWRLTLMPDGELRSTAVLAARRRRLALVVLIVAVAIGVAAFVVSHDRSDRGVSRKLPAVPVAPTLVDGRLPVEFYGARLFVPEGWEIMRYRPGIDCPYQDDHSVLLGSSSLAGCAPSTRPTLTPTSAIRMSMAAGAAPPGASPVIINGINGVLTVAADGSRTYRFPELGQHLTSGLIDQSWTLAVQITISGPETDDIINTLTPSARRIVLDPAAPPPAPTNWKTVHFEHVQFKVPKSWPVAAIPLTGTSSPPGCGGARIFATPAVLLGDGSPRVDCVPLLDGPYASDGVWAHFPPNDQPITSGSGTSPEQLEQAPTSINGLPVTALPPAVDGTVTVEIGTTNPPLRLTIGLGADPQIARMILYSLKQN